MKSHDNPSWKVPFLTVAVSLTITFETKEIKPYLTRGQEHFNATFIKLLMIHLHH